MDPQGNSISAPGGESPHLVQPGVLDYRKPSRGEAWARVGAPLLGAAAVLFRTGSRSRAVAQGCVALVWISLRREPANVAMGFWRSVAVVATAFALLWLVCPGEHGRRRPALFLAANAAGCVVAWLMPALN